MTLPVFDPVCHMELSQRTLSPAAFSASQQYSATAASSPVGLSILMSSRNVRSSRSSGSSTGCFRESAIMCA